MSKNATHGYPPELIVSRETSKPMTDISPLSKDEFAHALGGVPDDVLTRLETYLSVLKKWQKAINLVGPKTLNDPWRRHLLDCAQVAQDIRATDKVVDLGSGAGLPGLIIAIMTGADVHLVESDQRKSTFLREAARATDTSVTVHAERAEEIPPLDADVVTARALAPLPRLLPWVHRHLKKGGKSYLLKGSDVDQELTLAAKEWTMVTSRKLSVSDPSGTVLHVSALAPIDVR